MPQLGGGTGEIKKKSYLSVKAYVRSALHSLKILHIYLWANISSTAPLKCQNMFVNGEAEWQAELTRSKLKLTIFFVKARREVRQTVEGRGREGGTGWKYSTADLFLFTTAIFNLGNTHLRQRTDSGLLKGCAIQLVKRESIAPMPSPRGRKKTTTISPAIS